jgi:ABC-type antimicrobial peptide transport system permease subunit
MQCQAASGCLFSCAGQRFIITMRRQHLRLSERETIRKEGDPTGPWIKHSLLSSKSGMLLSRQCAPKLALFVLFYSVVAIIAVVGAIGLFNTLAMRVLEHRREIGILRSMGATGREVAQVFWTEGVSLGVVAWVIALIVGFPAASGFDQLLEQALFQALFVFDPTSLIVMLVFILVVATVASVGLVWGASRVKSAQTLRYE